MLDMLISLVKVWIVFLIIYVGVSFILDPGRRIDAQQEVDLPAQSEQRQNLNIPIFPWVEKKEE